MSDNERPISATPWWQNQLYLGGAFLVAGFLLNEWVLTKAFSSDGVLEPYSRVAVWCFDLLLIAGGVLLILRRISPLTAFPAVAAGIYVCLRLLLIWRRSFDPDEMEHLHAAWSFAQGQTLYKDFFELHGPLFYFLLWPIPRFEAGHRRCDWS